MSPCLFLPYGRCWLTDIELLDKPASAVPKSEKNSPCPLPPKCMVWELELMPVQVAVKKKSAYHNGFGSVPRELGFPWEVEVLRLFSCLCKVGKEPGALDQPSLAALIS